MESFLGYPDNLRMISYPLQDQIGYSRMLSGKQWLARSNCLQLEVKKKECTCHTLPIKQLMGKWALDLNTPSIGPEGKDNATCL